MKPRIALQLYSVRREMSETPDETLAAIAQMGYPAVQLAGVAKDQVASLKRTLADLGLAIAGNHVGIARLESALEEEIDLNLDLGNRDIICPALPQGRRESEADFRAYADLIARIGARCSERGCRFHYHNHAFEFVTFDGTYAMDILLGSTDPRDVLFEPDVYWIHVGGADPAAYIRRYPGRCPFIHIKDIDRTRDPSYAEIGAGTLDFAPIFAASEAVGAEWYVVEQDASTKPMVESVEISIRNLRAWGKL
ncbi:MAG: sugar phosphate isomerase/epimerase [Chloroflexi bacterium]|nr:sugar phosphate isomerase/epimerase [Chloroflexota bacterium]